MAERLLLGQIDNAATPTSAAAELYILSESYGDSVGTDVPLLVETEEVALAGPVGTAIYRRIEQPVTYNAACAIQVTPIVDFVVVSTVTAVAYTAPTQRVVDYADGVLAQVGTTLRVRTEVTSRQGPVELAAPTVGGQAKIGTASAPVGTPS